MSDQPQSKPPKWQEWRARQGRWAWVLSPEWASEWLIYWSQTWDFVRVIELVGKFAIVIAAVSWFLEADERKKAKHYRAWEVINTARGSTGDAGRVYALQDLNEDGISLAGASLSEAYLEYVKLPSANLREANLSGASLRGANLAGANLDRADLSRANLAGANLTGARLSRANLAGANLLWANLAEANLIEANLIEARLFQAALPRADLSRANLVGAKLSGANLSEANLTSAVLCRTSMADDTVNNTSCPSQPSTSSPN